MKIFDWIIVGAAVVVWGGMAYYHFCVRPKLDKVYRTRVEVIRKLRKRYCRRS